MTGRLDRFKAIAGRIALMIVVPSLVLVVLEGAASLLLLGNDLAGIGPVTVAETKHSRYDAELGWVSEPNVAIGDMYGPGQDLHTNSRGFRGRAETADSAPSGRRRVVCSGDSFTLGFGVGDDETWCAMLAATPDSQLEAINMGQGGYGFDQAFLWFRRDGVRLDHDVHVFAYITDDFRRMQEGRFLGYGKPQLELRGDSLVVTNVPAPTGRVWTVRANRAVSALQELRMIRLVQRLSRKFGSGNASTPSADSMTAAVAGAVIRDLARYHRERDSRLMVVHLPVRQDQNSDLSTEWRRRMRAASEREGVLFVDLVETFRRVDADSIPQMFIPWDYTGYAGGGGHYTAAGNAWVAAQLRPLVRAALPSAKERARRN